MDVINFIINNTYKDLFIIFRVAIQYTSALYDPDSASHSTSNNKPTTNKQMQ